MNRELSEFPIVQDALAKKKQRQKDADREIYQVVTKDLVRKLKYVGIFFFLDHPRKKNHHQLFDL